MLIVRVDPGASARHVRRTRAGECSPLQNHCDLGAQRFVFAPLIPCEAGVVQLAEPEAEKRSALSHIHHAQFRLGSALAWLGRRDEAVEWLRKAAQHGYPSYPRFSSDPRGQQQHLGKRPGAHDAGVVTLCRRDPVPDKAFFFADYEGTRITRGVTRITRVPTAGERAGMFTSAIKDPTTGLPFANNRIPADRIDPYAASIMALVPLPNQPGANNYFREADLLDDSDRVLGRIDWRPNANHSGFCVAGVAFSLGRAFGPRSGTEMSRSPPAKASPDPTPPNRLPGLPFSSGLAV